MAYNQSTGSLRVGDLLNEDDTDTSIDWDSDKIQFKTNNTLRFIIDNNGCGIGVTNPDAKLEVSGAIHISAELGGSDIPSTPAANDGGVLYGKEDGKLYYKSNTVAETDITSGGGGTEHTNLVTSGYLKVSGSSTLGDASGDSVTINAGTVGVPNLPSSTDNTVMVVNSSNQIGTDEINAKVWGTQLIENSGTPLNNQVATWGGTTTLGGESNLIFDGSRLKITGKLSASANINSVGYITTAAQLNASGSATIKGVGRISGSFRASGSVVLGDRASVNTTLYSEDIKLVNVPAGVDNTVLVVDSNGLMKTDEVDGRVWGSSLVDVTGVAKALQIPIFSDANTITGSNVVRWVGPQATLAVTGAIRSQGQIHVTEHAYATTAATEKWLPFYTLAEANAPNNATYINQMVVPFGGQLKRVVFRPSGSQHTANPVAKLYKASTPTQLINANDSGRYVETVSISMAAGPAKVGVFVFTGSAHFSAGDVVGISIDPAANPVEVNATCVWEYDVLGV